MARPDPHPCHGGDPLPAATRGRTLPCVGFGGKNKSMTGARHLSFFCAIVLALSLASVHVLAQPSRTKTLDAGGGKRIALVVGMSRYQHVSPLANPANDARLMAQTLRALGFRLVGGGAQLDLDKAGFDRVVQNFGDELQGADVGLFYYAGHGLQVRGANWLVPVTANPTKEADLDFQMLDASVILRQMESAGTRLNLMILDACRNNPFGGRGLRAVGGGLAQMEAPEGTLISYATQPGNVALDGVGDSPFTKALASTMRKPGLDVFRMFNEVGLEVKRATAGQQQPWVSSSPIDGDFYFVEPSQGGTAATNPAPTPVDAAAMELAFWESIESSTDAADFQEYLRQYPKGRFAGLARHRIAVLSQPKPVPALQQATVAPQQQAAVVPSLMGSHSALMRTISVRDFSPQGDIDPAIARNLTDVLRSDLRSASLASSGGQGGAPLYIVGKAIGAKTGQIQLQFWLMQASDNHMLVGRGYTSLPQNWRRIAHIMADTAFQAVTGEGGWADTRLAYVSALDREHMRLAIMDSDGANHRWLTDGRSPLISMGDISSGYSELVYASRSTSASSEEGTHIYLFNLDTGQQEKLVTPEADTPRFSPDGTKVIFSLRAGSVYNLYAVDLRSRETTRLTSGTVDDLCPSYSPDGARIAFVRAQSIYVMNADGTDLHPLASSPERIACALWSRQGSLIAFVQSSGSQATLGVIDAAGGPARALAPNIHGDKIAWAPNGRFIAYSRDEPDGSHLYVHDMISGSDRGLPTPGNAQQPVWSPLLK